MDPEWVGAGWYRPADGSHWEKASYKTKWAPCHDGDELGCIFRSYKIFKEYKRKLRLKKSLNKWDLRLKD